MAGTPPRVICAESIKAILDVTQSYASLFTLRRTPCFVPYFVFAAGLTRIVLESDSSAMNSSPSGSSAFDLSPDTGSADTPSPFRQGTLADNSNADVYMTGTDSGQASASPGSSSNTRSASANTSSTYATSVSAVPDDAGGLTQAVRQLREMSVGHPGAAQAGWVLHDFSSHQQDSR